MLRFLKNTSGNVALLTGALAIPFFAMAGGALDYTIANRKSSNLQNAIDSAVLAVGNEFHAMTNLELRTLAQNYLETNLSEDEFKNITNIEYNIDRRNGKIEIVADGKTDTKLLAVVGQNEFSYQRRASIQIGSNGYEIAMVLDLSLIHI